MTFVCLSDVLFVWRTSTHSISLAYILAGTSLFAAGLRKNWQAHSLIVMSAALGSGFNFIDFLINPPMMPMLMAFFVLLSSRRETGLLALSVVMAWFLGYSETWAAKCEDLVGKIEKGLEEDDPRNPATIADNVGDNVGDCAGMAADVFETYAVSDQCNCPGALTLGTRARTIARAAIVYPFVLGGISVLGAICGILFVNTSGAKPATVLMGSVGAGALVSAILFWPATHLLFPEGVMIGGLMRSPTDLYLASLVGLLMTGVIVVITNYYTSMSYGPVRKIARASETGHATNIIAGLAVGQHATALPVGFIGIAILLSFHFAGLYGIAIAVMSMLSMAGIIISLDAFGPITDNAGGIAVMSNLPKEIRGITDELDAVGNTMKAVTKGYAIASAGLAALVLFGSYVEELKAHNVAYAEFHFSLTEPKVIIGLFIGGLLPFILPRSAWMRWAKRPARSCAKCAGNCRRSREFCAAKTRRTTAPASIS